VSVCPAAQRRALSAVSMIGCDVWRLAVRRCARQTLGVTSVSDAAGKAALIMQGRGGGHTPCSRPSANTLPRFLHLPALWRVDAVRLAAPPGHRCTRYGSTATHNTSVGSWRPCIGAAAARPRRDSRGPPAAGRRRAPPPRRHAAPAPAHVLPVGVLDCQQVYMSAGSTRLVIICALSITLFHHHLHLHGAHAAPSCHTLTGPAFIACAAGQGPAGALRPINIFGVTASCMFPRLG